MARPSAASMLPGVLAAFAWITSLFAGVYCKFVSFTSTGGNTAEPVTLYFGIWYYQGWSVVQNSVQGTVILESCYNYPDGTNFDAQWRSAKAFSTMALIIGGVVTFWALLAGCLYPSSGAYKAGGLMYLVCCLFQGLSLLLLSSNACHDNNVLAAVEGTEGVNAAFPESCSMAAGGSCAIAGTVLWFTAALAALWVKPPVRSPITVETQDVTYTKTTGADGTAVVSEQVVKGEPVPVGEMGKVEQAV